VNDSPRKIVRYNMRTMGGTRVDRAASATDQRAVFAALADRQLDAAYRLAGVILGDPFEAQDATHDAVVTAWKQYRSLRDPDRFEAWFSRILVNTCRDRLRRRGRRPSVQLEQAPELRGVADLIGQTEDRLILGRAFETLNPDHRVVIALRFYADLSVDQIAAQLGVPAGTVKSRLHLATRRLHAALGGEENR
jgi:RNA polymerase sigma-70 factor (ECF subfamily)